MWIEPQIAIGALNDGHGAGFTGRQAARYVTLAVPPGDGIHEDAHHLSEQATWTCQSTETIWAGEYMAGGSLTLNRNWGVYQTNCFYDPISRELVGANVVNDTTVYCNNTSASMSQGTVPVPYPHYCIGSSATTERSMSCASSRP